MMENFYNYTCEEKIYDILVVEDSEFFNNAVTNSLEDDSYNVTQVFTLQEANKLIHTQKFDYILLDIILPDGDASVLIDQLPEDIKSKIIILSGDEDAQRRDYLFQAGILDYFSKSNPFPLIMSDIKKLFCTLEKNTFINVLIIDDSSFMRIMLKNLLSIRRFNTIETKSGKEAMEALKENKIHLILLDYEMPVMDGAQTLEKIKNHDGFLDIPVIMISSHSSKDLVARVLKHGASDFIVKPFSNEELLLKCDIHVAHFLDIKIGQTREKELNSAMKKVIQLENNKSIFLANMSHEIRTPLNAILGFIDLLKEESKDRMKSLEYLNIMEDSSRSLITIIEDILDFSKIENGKLTIDKIDFNTKVEFELITKLFDAQCSQKNIFLSLYLDDNLPEVINSDPLRIKQVVSNLISNAVKFTPSGKSISVVISYKNNLLNISVKDEGMGIEEDKLVHIFEAFNQEDNSTTREFGGTGLGLSISNSLVKLLGGKLKVDSVKDKGSEFYFSLPVKKGTMQNETLISVSNFNFIGKKVLLVEDNKANQIFMKIILQTIKLDFDIANNGVEAVELYKQNHDKYHIILMDENMPKMNGIEATMQILKFEKKNNLKHTPIIALTANAIKGDREKFLDAGMDEYLSKPIKKEVLQNALGCFL